MTSPRLIVRNLRKRYGAIDAVTGLSFEVQSGEIFGLLGPNGAGKTTTLECISGLRDPDAGEVLVNGSDLRRQPRAVREKLGVALQHTALQDKITPREALRLFASFYPRPLPPDTLLERFGLKEKANAAYETLSGGQRQRLALALALLHQPDVLLLDEPTVGLDPQARHDLQAEILRLKREGHTVVLATHYLAEAESLCDRVAIIDRGVLVALGAPRSLIAGSAGAQRVVLETSRPLLPAMVNGIPGIEELECDGSTIRFRTPQPLLVLPALSALLTREQIDLVDLRIQKASLESIFLELTAKADPSGSSR